MKARGKEKPASLPQKNAGGEDRGRKDAFTSSSRGRKRSNEALCHERKEAGVLDYVWHRRDGRGRTAPAPQSRPPQPCGALEYRAHRGAATSGKPRQELPGLRGKAGGRAQQPVRRRGGASADRAGKEYAAALPGLSFWRCEPALRESSPDRSRPRGRVSPSCGRRAASISDCVANRSGAERIDLAHCGPKLAFYFVLEFFVWPGPGAQPGSEPRQCAPVVDVFVRPAALDSHARPRL